MSGSRDSIPPNAKIVFRGKIFEVWQWEQKMFDGSVEVFEHLRRSNTAVVVPTVGDKILTTKQTLKKIKQDDGKQLRYLIYRSFAKGLMKKRIFVAIKVSEELAARILNWEKKSAKLPVRWLAGKNLHITLIPPWYEEDIERVKKLLENLKDVFSPFKIFFQKVSYGPNPGYPRLIWAEGPTPQAMVNLKKRLEQILKISGEKRPFLLHLTIARFRPEDFSGFSQKHLEEKVEWRDEVNSFVLMESRLTRSGANYEILAEIPL